MKGTGETVVHFNKQQEISDHNAFLLLGFIGNAFLKRNTEKDKINEWLLLAHLYMARSFLKLPGVLKY